MSGEATLITQGTQLSLRRVPRKVKTLVDDGVSVYDSEEFAYLVNVDIGGQDFWVTFDTGSSDLWVVSSGCAEPDCQGVPVYSPSASSTLHLSSILFRLFYLLGSVQGTVATEIVTLGAIQIVSQTLALANETNGLYLRTTGNSGILGLSFPPAAAIRPTTGTTVLDNIFSHLGDSNRFFAFKLDTLNGTAQQITYYPVPLSLSTSLVPDAPSAIGIFDTGTTLILGPTLDVNAFWESVGTGGSTRYNAQTNLWEVRCDRAVDVRFTFGQGDEGREYAVHPEDISWAEGAQEDGWCMGGVQINDGADYDVLFRTYTSSIRA
ncbi:aspartic peptidase domain-containing protein [Boletus edulis]|nr:aspartic peptidase domain-containing protein [Boletus edulis]